MSALANELDVLLPSWAHHVDVTLFERRGIDTSAVGQVRTFLARDDESAALACSRIIWSDQGHPEEWYLPQQWQLWYLAWHNEVERRRAS